MSESKTLMHPREAHNHKDYGYFPTDNGTMNKIISYIEPNDKETNVLDPCCGDGLASTFFYNVLPNSKIYGIEKEKQRYEVSKKKIDHVFNADFFDVQIGRGNFDCLFLNPPYGRGLADKYASTKVERLEKQFLLRAFPALKAGGLLIYIVPQKSVDDSMLKWLISRFINIKIYKAAVDDYKQIVIMAKKLKTPRVATGVATVGLIDNLKQDSSSCPNESNRFFNVTNSKFDPKVIITKFSADAALSIKKKYQGQWPIFDTLFSSDNEGQFIQPLHDLSKWHLALLVTSGAVQGEANNGKQCLLIKGSVKKFKKHTSSVEENLETNSVTTTFEARDCFEARITAIDLTLGSPSYGSIFIIK